MTRRPTGRPHRTARLAATVLGAAALVLAGCSSGAVTQTDTTVASVIGSEGNAGELLLRDVTLDSGPQVVVPAGGTVAVRATLVNNGLEADELVSVSSPYFPQVEAEGETLVPGNSAVRVVGTAPGPVGPPPGPTTSGSARVLMIGAAQVMHSGPTYPVTFTFARSGPVTLPVPVEPTASAPVS